MASGVCRYKQAGGYVFSFVSFQCLAIHFQTLGLWGLLGRTRLCLSKSNHLMAEIEHPVVVYSQINKLNISWIHQILNELQSIITLSTVLDNE